MKHFHTVLKAPACLLFFVLAGVGCSSGSGGGAATEEPGVEVAEVARACDAEPEVLTTENGVEFVRTPDSCFENLPDFPYEGKFLDIDGLHQAYVEAGPEEGDVVLLLHGQPSWSYLYRKMIPVLADAGYRVIAMDHMGLGRSDKPINIDAYTYLGHYDRLVQFIETLELRDINLFVQDWGSLIGLRVAGLNPDWFASIGVGDGSLPVIPAGFMPFPVVENPEEVVDLESPFADAQDQQEPYYDGCDLIVQAEGGNFFGVWMEYAMKGASFSASEVLEALTWFPLSAEVEAAYDAPYPSRIYMAGIRKFPSIINDLPGQNDEALAGLLAFEKPFITIWAANDPGNLGSCAAQDFFIDNVPGARGQDHVRLPEASHFLQDDQGEEIARRLVAFYENPAPFVPADPAPPAPDVPANERVGFEILQQVSDDEIIVWISDEISLDEFDALELPDGWIKNQPRESVVAGGSFARSPGAEEDGPLDVAELFGFAWRHNATIVEVGISLDDQGLLNAAQVAKYHTISFDAGDTLTVLISPEGEQYLRVSRDLNRASDNPTLPSGWRIVEAPIDEVLSLTLPNPTLNIRADNQDSFQGPVTVLSPESIVDGGDSPSGPLALNAALCENPGNMDVLLNSGFFAAAEGDSGSLNTAQVQRMIASPDEGPFYMFNLIRYRERALYSDGRDTDLTGREANALYSPLEFLSAIGARVAFNAEVGQQIEGDDIVWEDVAVVEYPCPIAFFAMLADPAFQARLIHKDAGVENTIVIVTNLEPTTLPEDFQVPSSPYPATDADPAFEWVNVLDFRDEASYEAGADEAPRSGTEAWREFEASGSEAAERIGIYPTARFVVQGVFQGDDRSWDEIHVDRVPSLAAFEALLEDTEREAGGYHREAALANHYELIAFPAIDAIPGSPTSDAATDPLPVTDLGVGTLCMTDADCAGIGTCLSDGSGIGFCTRMCGAGECGEPYLCCSGCAAIVAAQLPFEESACLPGQFVEQLTATPASCRCN